MSNSHSSQTCTLQVKTLKGQIVVWNKIPVTSSVHDLYQRVHTVETTPNGNWKLLIVTSLSLRTLKWSEKDRPLRDFGVEPHGTYRVEVVLDMGACQGPLCRKLS